MVGDDAACRQRPRGTNRAPEWVPYGLALRRLSFERSIARGLGYSLIRLQAINFPSACRRALPALALVSDV